MDLNLDREIQREIEFNVEVDKLEDVKQQLNDEIIKSIEKRKEFANYILDYRKKVLEEYRDDEDEVIKFFDHERYMKEEGYKHIDKKISNMMELKTSPYFGSVDFYEDDFGKDRIYIGKYGFSPEGSYESVIVDWRAPVASLFYKGKVGETSYTTPRGEVDVDIILKRQFLIKKGKLEGLFNSEIDVKDEILQSVLCKNSEDKLKDIVMTIQKEQDEIIRQPRNVVTVVDGVAGSGKTTIALHRIAYLLYNFRAALQDKIMILGPNLIFMDYISEVLPNLGEKDINQSTFAELAKKILNIDDVMTFNSYMERLYSGDEEFAREIEHKRSKEFIASIEELAKDIEKNLLSYYDIKLYDKLVISKEEIADLYNKHYVSMPCYRRIKKIKRILFSKIRDTRYEIYLNIVKEFKDEYESLKEDDKLLNLNDIEFRKRLKIRELIKESSKIKSELNKILLKDPKEIYEEFNDSKALTQDDLPAIMYLKILLDGYKYENEIKHIVIDEAQDYSELQFKVIRRLFDCKSFTIVGDSNQKIASGGECVLKNIHEIYDDLKVNYFPLVKSYRSTHEIMEYANQYIEGDKTVPLVRHGKPVESLKCKDISETSKAVQSTLSQFHNMDYDRIAIICDSLDIAEELYGELRDKVDIKIVSNEDTIYKKGTAIMPVYFGKGLEFDGVIMIKDEGENKEKLNYVKATRALHELVVIELD